MNNNKEKELQPSLASAIRRAFGFEMGLKSLLSLFENCVTRWVSKSDFVMDRNSQREMISCN